MVDKFQKLKFDKPPKNSKRKGRYFDCKECGISFYYSPSKLRNRLPPKFCSRICQHKHHSILKTCPTCGNQFRIRKSWADDRTYCSDECKYLPLSEPNCVCERCNEAFRVNPARIGTAKYCSPKCCYPPMYIDCDNCGKTFKTFKSANARFCSKKCFRLYQGETSIEKTVRLALDKLKINHQQESQIGKYLIDFYLPEHRIALECDGDYWHNLQPGRDEKRDRYLAKHNILTIRLLQSEIETPGLLSLIKERLQVEIP